MSQTSFPGGSVALPNWGVMRAEGPDAHVFLQGQLTNDVASLSADQSRFAGYCSAKGRLLASFVVCRPAPESFLMACSADLLEQTLKRLSMFVLRARCKLMRADVAVHGIAGEAGRAALAAAGEGPVGSHRLVGGASLIRLPDAAAGQPRWLWIGSAAPPPMPALPLAGWERLEIEAGIPRVTASTVELFVPQMLNFEVIGGVDFRKGCYPGQEVVARSQYRGTIKRRTLRYDADADAAPGADVYASSDPTQPAGTVVNAAADLAGGPTSLLVEIKLALADAELHLRDAAGPLLRPAPLPYSLPSETA